MDATRYSIFKFQKLDPNLVTEKLDQVFEKFDCAAKIKVALGSV